MAQDIEFSPEADEDLNEAIDFLGADSPSAKRLAELIDSAISRLLEHPQSGRDIGRGKRSLFVPGSSYSIIYEFNDEKLNVLAFAHAARRPGFWRNRGNS